MSAYDRARFANKTDGNFFLLGAFAMWTVQSPEVLRPEDVDGRC